MKEKHFYVTIEVTAQMHGDIDKHELRGRILRYIHNEKQRENHVNSCCYVHGEHTLSIYDENGNEV